MAILNDGLPIPLSRRAVCTYCATTIDMQASGVFQFAQGWLENRLRGGANTIALPKRRNQYACHECIDRMRHGVPALQARLFDAGPYDDD